MYIALIRAHGNIQPRPGQHQNRDDNAIQTQNLGEDEDEHHADVKPGLLRAGADCDNGITPHFVRNLRPHLE